jgi:hypothetical protein
LHDPLTDPEIEDTLINQSDLQIAAKELADRAYVRNEQGRAMSLRAKPDDITVVLVRV